MSNTDIAIREAVESFVEQLRGLITQAALESVQVALNGGSALPRRGSKPGRSGSPSAVKTRQKGIKRSPEELDALVKRLLAYIVKHPGQRIEQIGASLGVPSKEFVLPVKKLLSEKQITTKGQKRATAYFAK